MRCYRQLLNISHKGHITTADVHRKSKQPLENHDEVLTLDMKRKLRLFDHISKSSGLANTILQDTVKGKRRAGR